MYPPWTSVEEAVRLLQDGQVVAIPTETVYGLAGNAYNPDALAKIFAAKERPTFDPLIVHICDIKQLADVARETGDASLAEACRRLWRSVVSRRAQKPCRIRSASS